MTQLDKSLIILSIVITSMSYISVFVVSAYLAFRAPRKGLSFLAAGFGLWMMQQLILWLASPSLLASFGMQIPFLHPLGLILVTIGFFRLICGRPEGRTKPMQPVDATLPPPKI